MYIAMGSDHHDISNPTRKGSWLKLSGKLTCTKPLGMLAFSFSRSNLWLSLPERKSRYRGFTDVGPRKSYPHMSERY